VLSWTAPLDGYVQKGGRIRIQYKPHTDSAWLDSASVDGAQTKAKLFNLIQGGRYDFQLQAVNYMGVQSAWVQALDFLVAKDTTAPAAPTGVVAQAGTGALISLDWDDNTEVDFDEYHVYRGTTSSTGSMTKIAQVGASRFVDSMVTIGTTYYYAIKAVDRSENVSAFSAVVSATPTGVSGSGTNTTAPSNAGQLTFVSSGAYQASDGTTFSYINVSVPALPTGAAWQNLVINNSGTYEIVGQLTNTSTVTSYRVDDLVAGKSYELGLIAYNSDGVPSSYVAGLTFPRTTPMDTTAPAVPSGLSAQAGTGKLIVLTWSPNTEADFSEYQVWRNTSNSSGSATKIAETSATAFADATVTIGITYYYWLKAADCTDNVSGFSSVASAAASNVPASQVDQTAPTAPSAASKTASGSYLSADGNVSSYFDFSVPGLPGGAKWQSLMYRRTGGNDWQVGWQGSNAGTVTVRLDDLTPGVSYDVATVAISAFGVFSGYTAATGSPFTGQVDTTAPAAPTGVHASNDGVTPSLSPGGYLMMGVRFYWTNPTDADFDHIEYKVTVINDSTAVGTVVQIAKSTELIYRMVSISGFWWFRSVDRTGNFSAWVGTPETAASYQTLGIGSIASENKAATKLSGLSVGDASASSVRKVIAHFETTAVWVTSATPSTAQNFDLDISNRGFTTKPDSVKITAASPDDGVGAQYAYDDAASTSTNLRVRLYGRGGANLPASTAFRYSIDATCYN
jgi:fibronectin type 3 domain-containing protein